MTVAQTRCMNGSSMPSSLPCRTARRKMRRSTYSRPVLSGNTPSAIRNALARAWSAMTRSEVSLSGDGAVRLTPAMLGGTGQDAA